MGRKPKQGIDFYPMDIGFLHDTKIKRLLQKRGSVGVLIYLSVIDHIYGGTGYYIDDDDDLLCKILDDTSGKYAPDENIVRAVIEDCCSLGLLSRVATSKTITAHRVQVQFYLATKRRTNIQVDRDKWLLSKEEMEELGADSPIYRFLISVDKNGIFANKNGIFAGNNPQSKSKNITHTLDAPACAREPQAPSVDMVRAYFMARGITDPIEVAEFIRYNEARGWSCLPSWEQKATLWISKVPAARRANQHRGAPAAKTTSTAPTSFDTASFFEAALRRTYSDNHQ